MGCFFAGEELLLNNFFGGNKNISEGLLLFFVVTCDLVKVESEGYLIADVVFLHHCGYVGEVIHEAFLLLVVVPHRRLDDLVELHVQLHLLQQLHFDIGEILANFLLQLLKLVGD